MAQEQATRQEIVDFMRFKHPELTGESDNDLFEFAAHKYPELHVRPALEEIPSGAPTIGPQPSFFQRLTREFVPKDASLSDIWTGPSFIAQHPVDTIDLLHKGLIEATGAGAVQQLGRAHEALTKKNPDPVEALVHGAAAMVPIVGPYAAETAHQGAEYGVTDPEFLAKMTAIVAPEIAGTAIGMARKGMKPSTQLTRSGQAQQMIDQLTEDIRTAGHNIPPQNMEDLGKIAQGQFNERYAQVEHGTAHPAIQQAFEDEVLTGLVEKQLNKNPHTAYQLLFMKQMSPERYAMLKKQIGAFQYRGMVAQGLQDFFNTFRSEAQTAGLRANSMAKALESPASRWSKFKDMLEPDQYQKLQDIVKYASDNNIFRRALQVVERRAIPAGILAEGYGWMFGQGFDAKYAGGALAAAILARAMSRAEGMTIVQGLMRAAARNDLRRLEFYSGRLGDFMERDNKRDYSKKPEVMGEPQLLLGNAPVEVAQPSMPLPPPPG